MPTPNYVLKLEQVVFKEVDEPILRRIIRLSSPVIFFVYQIRQFLNRGFSFWGVLSFIIVMFFLLVWAWLGAPRRDDTVPCELRFYDDHMEHYIERHYMSKKDTREEFYSVKYDTVTWCTYTASYPKFDVCGDMQYKKHKYNAAGQLEDKVFREGFIEDFGFWIQLPKDTVTEDFIAEIEAHSPLKVDVL